MFFSLDKSRKFDLSKTCQKIKRDNADALNRFLKETYTVKNYDSRYAKLVDIPIKNIITLNIDNLLEKIYEENSDVIVNVVGSSIAREADNVFYTLAGPEIAVATTKAYSTQLIAAYILAIEFAKVRGQIDEERYSSLLGEMATLPDKIESILQDTERIQWFAAKQANTRDIFFVGRGIDYAISLEGSLKLKEISYIHSEAYAAGELKHGTISLIEDGTLVIGILTQQELYEKCVSNMVECKSRGAYLMALTNRGNYSMEYTAEFVVYVPKTDEHFAASLAVVPLQLLAYYVSVARGLDVDKPRNLAKSVTVE